jgi:hypothetical protein
MVILDTTPLRWADLVFHVLAHVRATAHLPSSNYDSTYVRYAQRFLGPAEQRVLGEDAVVLGRVTSSHDSLSSLQLLAWLYASIERAEACAASTLEDLGSDDVDAPELLTVLQRTGPAVEILRCAALLELESWSTLPAVDIGGSELQSCLDLTSGAAPHLERCRVRVVRSLRLRGRVRRREIWVGAPSQPLALSSEHAAWQAAHEATVSEVAEVMAAMGRQATFRGVEHVAVVLLAERSRVAGMEGDHAQWFAHFGNPPSRQPCDLSSDEVAVLKHCVQ